ncbi:MAG: 30S ribosomal protein S3 [Verrucomicrobia bacterium]|nr:MAG: 30S ribosomal protein S3 [Verrucomicrobiota bacterium]
MGQKVNPIGMRVTLTKDWRSRWFAEKRDYAALVLEDEKIRNLVKRRLRDAAVPEVWIERYANRVRITIHTARPGLVIGRKGQDLERLREDLVEATGKEIYLDVKEIRDPDRNAQLVAEAIALQLERRVSFRRAMKRAVQVAMDMGVLGIKVETAGRLAGAELARRETYKAGKVPLQTFRANIDYGFAEAHTTAGLIGVKVWICHPSQGGLLGDANREE